MGITELYEDIRPWQYLVDQCGMKQESLDLMNRSVEFILVHHRERGVKPRSRLGKIYNI